MSGVPVVGDVIDFVEDVVDTVVDVVVEVADFVGDVVEDVAEVVVDAGEAVIGIAEDIVTLDVEGLAETAGNIVEGVVHTITHPTEDPFATIMLAVAVYSGYQSMTSTATAEAAILSEAEAARVAGEAAAVAKGMTGAAVTHAGAAASNAVLQAAGVTIAEAGIASAVSGPMFDAQFLGSQIGMEMAAASTGLAEAGVVVSSGAQWGMAGPSLSLQAGTFAGVGAGSAAGSMVGIGGITGVSAGNVFLEDLSSAWTDTDFSASEDFEFSSDYAESEYIESEAAWGDKFVDGITEKVKNFGSEFLDDITEDYKKFTDDPMGEAWNYAEREAQRRYPFISDPKIPTSLDELIELGADAMASNFENWSPTISYQAGGDPGSSTSESYPSFTRAETGILGDPFNLEGQDLALTVSGLASQLQQQRGLPFGQQEMGMAPPVQQFRDRQAPAEELKQLLDPSYAVNQYQQPMVNEMINQLNANSQVRGLAPSAEGVSRGVAPLLSKLRQDNLAALNRAAGLDLEARGQGVQQRAGDITSQLGYQDIGIGGDVARKNITLNSLLALAQMSQPTVIGGTTTRGSSQAATPGTVFSGSVPVGNILSTGWDWLTGGDNSGVDQRLSGQGDLGFW